MQEFICHKRVKAAKIVTIDGFALQRGNSAVTVTTEGDEENIHNCPLEMFSRYIPQPGDYLVEYPPFKGRPAYQAFSPGDVFEDGYSLAPS